MPIVNPHDLPLWANALIFLGGGALIWMAGTRLTRDLDEIGERTGLDQAFVGMLLLGGITSLPEVANAITASAIGVPGLAVNNLLGSAAINVLLLAVADAAVGRDAVTSQVAKPSTLMMGALCMLVLIAVAAAVTTGDVPVSGVGLWSTGLCALSIGSFWIAAGYDRRAPWTIGMDEPDEDRLEPSRRSLRALVLRSAVAGTVIFIAGYTLSITGDAVAAQTGIGAGMVGFVLIGLATSMPELSTIVAALRIRRYELAFGQVLGTNFINLSLILLADAVFAGEPVINELGRFETLSSLLGAALVGVFLVGLLERRNPTVLRMGYDSVVVILLFTGGVALLYAVR